MIDLIANSVYHLQDSLLQSVSPKQWETINVLMETSAQEQAAKKLGSTVSRNLRRGFWWQIQETQAAMERMVRRDVRLAKVQRPLGHRSIHST